MSRNGVTRSERERACLNVMLSACIWRLGGQVFLSHDEIAAASPPLVKGLPDGLELECKRGQRSFASRMWTRFLISLGKLKRWGRSVFAREDSKSSSGKVIPLRLPSKS